MYICVQYYVWNMCVREEIHCFRCWYVILMRLNMIENMILIDRWFDKNMHLNIIRRWKLNYIRFLLPNFYYCPSCSNWHHNWKAYQLFCLFSDEYILHCWFCILAVTRERVFIDIEKKSKKGGFYDIGKHTGTVVQILLARSMVLYCTWHQVNLQLQNFYSSLS